MKTENIAQAAIDESADVLAISSLSTTTYPSLKSMAEKFKKAAPDILTSEVVNQARKKGYALLFRYRILHRPVKTLRLIFKFSRFMEFSNVVKLLASPFRKRTLTRKPELPASMIEKGLERPVRVTL
jgi:hypothetical protein